MTDSSQEKLEQLATNTIRMLAVDAIEKANSGHPGMPMGMADCAFVLFHRFLRHDPNKPDWPGRDRFVLSGATGPCCSIRSCTCMATSSASTI